MDTYVSIIVFLIAGMCGGIWYILDVLYDKLDRIIELLEKKSVDENPKP